MNNSNENIVDKKKNTSSFWTNFFKSPLEKEDLIDVLLSMPPFEKLNKRYLNLLLKIIHTRTYQENEFIFRQDDPGIALYIIRKGSVIIKRTEEESDERILAEFERGDFFGDMALLEGEYRSASAIAKEKTKLAVIFKPDLDEFINKYPNQGIFILRGIAQIIALRLRVLNKEFYDLYKQLKKE